MRQRRCPHDVEHPIREYLEYLLSFGKRELSDIHIRIPYKAWGFSLLVLQYRAMREASKGGMSNMLDSRAFLFCRIGLKKNSS